MPSMKKPRRVGLSVLMATWARTRFVSRSLDARVSDAPESPGGCQAGPRADDTGLAAGGGRPGRRGKVALRRLEEGMAAEGERFDPLLMAVLSRRLEAIIREMSNTVMRASRSAVITNARDMSCGILTYDHRLICVEEAMPIHVSALELTTEPITALFDDGKEGDAFLNNSPYHGVTHHADMTLCVPVFARGEPLFRVLARSHHADVGAPEPTTYLPCAATLQQEGVYFPCIRIQENGSDKKEGRGARRDAQDPRAPHLVRRLPRPGRRLPHRRAAPAGARGEIRDRDRPRLRRSLDGLRRAAAAIRDRPAGTWRHSCAHDPIPGVADEEIPITASVTVDPEGGKITVDLRDNPDCVPGGVNLSEACAQGACRIDVLLRDGCVVGRPTFPAGTSVATTNANDRLINAVQCCFAQMGAPHGLAEGGGNFSAGLGVVSGTDDRDGGPAPCVNQFCVGLSGGPGLHGHDGRLTYEAPDGGGVLALDSIEIDEAQYPILMEERRIARDTMGAGRWNGAPATRGAYRTVAGGGYGDPFTRDPAAVARDVSRGWLGAERAARVYGVALRRAENGIDSVVDEEGTRRLRAARGRPAERLARPLPWRRSPGAAMVGKRKRERTPCTDAASSWRAFWRTGSGICSATPARPKARSSTASPLGPRSPTS